jgi:hypothetical protein
MSSSKFVILLINMLCDLTSALIASKIPSWQEVIALRNTHSGNPKRPQAYCPNIRRMET